ncbi:MAG TPA: c-type cytochrome [Bacteroidia bacterium]|jgi:hypothetical protein|nr:c-type cytochrome [Bacteroidia bacterium]
MKKWKLGAILIIAAVVTLGASSNNEKKVPENFKNLKVLPQNITKDALDSIMHEFTVSLGVRCGFCHARKSDTTQKGLDFASDAKDEKTIARNMMKMTEYLNTTYFNFNNSTKPDTIHTIICYTCHRGKKEPASDDIMPDYKKLEQEQQEKWKQQQGKK